MGGISLVVFDVGSVLVEAGRTLADDIALAGFVIEPAWLADFESRLHAHPSPNVGAIAMDRYFDLFAELSFGRFTPGDARHIVQSGLVREHEGVVRVFDALDVASIESALLSNINEAEWTRMFPVDGVMSEFPSLRRARYRFASYLIGATKPRPEAFHAVEQGTDRKPDQILFFDDLPANVAAARDRGWASELIDHRGDTVAQLLAWLRHHEVIC